MCPHVWPKSEFYAKHGLYDLRAKPGKHDSEMVFANHTPPPHPPYTYVQPHCYSISFSLIVIQMLRRYGNNVLYIFMVFWFMLRTTAEDTVHTVLCRRWLVSIRDLSQQQNKENTKTYSHTLAPRIISVTNILQIICTCVSKEKTNKKRTASFEPLPYERMPLLPLFDWRHAIAQWFKALRENSMRCVSDGSKIEPSERLMVFYSHL